MSCASAVFHKKSCFFWDILFSLNDTVFVLYFIYAILVTNN